MKTKKGIVIFISLILMFSCCSVSANSVLARTPAHVAFPDTSPDQSKVLSARFLNMLNHNFAYDEDYETGEALVNAAAIALRNQADEDGFLPASIVAEYVKDFYGVSVEDFSVFNTEFAQRDGYVYLIPRGFTTFTHSLVLATHNEDDTYTVVTRAIESTHDDEPVLVTVETLFAPDADSSFGFHIVRSDILKDVISI